MFVSRVYEGETAAQLSKRLACPVCMLLRANGLLSTAWLFPGREIIVPKTGACERALFPCPLRLARAKAFSGEGWILKNGDSAETIARAKGLPKRIVISAIGNSRIGKGVFFPVREAGMRIQTVAPEKTWRDFENFETLMVLNAYFGPLYPGMKILMYGE